MSDIKALCDSIGPIAGRIKGLQREAAQQYKPMVDDILHSRSRDAKQIEQTLDRLLDFCGHEPVLLMFKQLCRHYWDIDPVTTASYINAYREYWDSENVGNHRRCQAPARDAGVSEPKPPNILRDP